MQKIKNYLNRMKGMERVIFESACSVVFCLSAYFIALFCGASQEVALVVTAVTAAAAVVAAAAAAAAVVAFAVVVAAVAAVVAFAVVAVDGYKIKWWKTLSFYFVLGSLLFISFIYSTPLAIALFAVSVLTIVAIALKPKGIAYLKNHPPQFPEIVSTYRAPDEERLPPETTAQKLYRRLYLRYGTRFPEELTTEESARASA